MSARVPAAPDRHPLVSADLVPEDLPWPCCWSDDCDGAVAAWRWDMSTAPEGPGWLPVCRKHARGRVAWPTPAQCKVAGQPYRRPTPKSKTPSKTALRAKCDRMFAAWVTSTGECEALDGELGVACSERMQCAHIISRKYLGTRWHPLNAICLCSAHHVFFTHHELEWEKWRDAYVGERYAWLRDRAIKTAGPPDYAAVLRELEGLSAGRVAS